MDTKEIRLHNEFLLRKRRIQKQDWLHKRTGEKKSDVGKRSACLPSK